MTFLSALAGTEHSVWLLVRGIVDLEPGLEFDQLRGFGFGVLDRTQGLQPG